MLGIGSALVKTIFDLRVFFLFFTLFSTKCHHTIHGHYNVQLLLGAYSRTICKMMKYFEFGQVVIAYTIMQKLS